MTLSRRLSALGALGALAFAACQPAAPGATTAAPTTAPTTAATTAAPTPTAAATTAGPTQVPAANVRVQLQWVPQAQFAGIFAAQDQGYYSEENLGVTIVPGGPDVIPQQAGSAENGPEFTTSWVPKVLEAREAGSDLVNIAQVFQRSGTLSVSWKDSNITKPADFKGKKVGVWDFGNEYEVTAAAKKAGLEAGKDYEKVIQAFDMSALLKRDIDVAEAMIYNEYAQVLETKNPDTGELYKPEDLNVIDYNKEGTAMLQDAIFARASWLAQPGNEDVAVRFLRATFRGWIYCRENQERCAEITAANGSTLGKGHQAWMMNEVNALIWPSPNGIGQIDDALYQQTVAIAKDAGVLKKGDPSPDAVRKDLAQRALEGITEDTKATSFQKGTVQVTPGGE